MLKYFQVLTNKNNIPETLNLILIFSGKKEKSQKPAVAVFRSL
ncbi:hypothetical protein LEP1GSC066_0612 [Leptospira sp. serovar Kenya str. Sh9]|nr:hypothetical protein LEP1GSC066_0612 [Leptospira sp. serovar Kenya str. Sh9]